MKICPNCKEEVEDSFDLCWNCSYCFSEGKMTSFEEAETYIPREIQCNRCSILMKSNPLRFIYL